MLALKPCFLHPLTFHFHNYATSSDMVESNPVGRDKYESRVGGLQGYGEGVKVEGMM